MAITLELPRDLEEHLEQGWPDLPRKALEALVVEGYRDGLLSHGRIGELLGLGSADTDVFLIQHNALLDYDEDDLSVDIAASRRLATARQS